MEDRSASVIIPEAVARRRAVTAQYPKAMDEVVIVFGTVVFVDLTPVSRCVPFKEKLRLLAGSR